eukprot:CAMPEP_0118998682 /NCGR_PEP_ID=MMETSP1173-20130426/63201_1 /TAXON_ID=1034831 /ORGANISM="Rhizochromulina marina cf, Strain CCMP1243" /LENGTH=541 /DNA_ID=CAMNT_0006950181 /DNA_START=29 /DNA_END=1655 /DNA_ORIENTATION=+
MRAVLVALALVAIAPASAFVPHRAPRALKAQPLNLLANIFGSKAPPAEPTADLITQKESVDTATRHWCSTVTSGAEDNWQRVVNLYAKDAKLWGTVSEDLRGEQDLIDYFKFFAMIPGLSLKPGSYKSDVQVMGDSAINSGYYTFEIPQKDGSIKAVPARFTFVYRKREEALDGIEWEIVNHHSSAVPEQPDALSPVLEQTVDAATRHWCETVTSGADNNWARVCALYAEDAKLWGTVSEDLRGEQDLVDYFKFFAMIPKLSLKPGSYKSDVQVMGDSAINSGYYTFEIPQKDGSIKAVPARFTFVYRKREEALDGIEWEIVNHHSSAVPEQPDALSPVLEQTVDAATRHWCETVTSGADNNWARVCALYAEDAKLWGTVSEDLRGEQDLVDYFKFFAMIPNLNLKDGSYKSDVQMLPNDMAVNSGYYTFEMPNPEGGVKSVPARFTFVYRKREEPTPEGIMWDIVNHHSSATPAQPEELKPILAKAKHAVGARASPPGVRAASAFLPEVLICSGRGSSDFGGSSPRPVAALHLKPKVLLA